MSSGCIGFVLRGQMFFNFDKQRGSDGIILVRSRKVNFVFEGNSGTGLELFDCEEELS